MELEDYVLIHGERLSTVLRIASHLPRDTAILHDRPRKKSFLVGEDSRELVGLLDLILRPTPLKKSAKQLGFLALYASVEGRYWFKPNRGFFNAVHESLASVEQLIDELGKASDGEYADEVGATYRRLADIIEGD